MTRLYIPPLRAEFTLMEDWTFPLYNEHRNSEFARHMKVTYPDSYYHYSYTRAKQSVDVTLPKGTVMYIDRYYIKNGGSEFDSVTFRARMGKKTQRFWVKLVDANHIEAEFLPEE